MLEDTGLSGVCRWFITIDGDNETLPGFWNLRTENIPPELPSAQGRGVLSWNSYNPMTGLAYGNGGLKLWSFDFVSTMETHERAPSGSTVVDFCWDDSYVQMSAIMSITRPYASAVQAFCAGFREGAKMPLRYGESPGPAHSLSDLVHDVNMRRLVTWCSVGAHVEHGEHAIRGAILGFYMVHVVATVSLSEVSNLDFIHGLHAVQQNTPTNLNRCRELIWESTGIFIPIFGPRQSLFLVQSTRPTSGLEMHEAFLREQWKQPLTVPY